jgi:hypothetical protein
MASAKNMIKGKVANFLKKSISLKNTIHIYALQKFYKIQLKNKWMKKK